MSKHSDQIADILEMNEYLRAIAAREADRNQRTGATQCVVEWRLFSSFTDAAYWLARHRPQYFMNMKAYHHRDAHRVIRNLIALVRNRCWAACGEKSGPVYNGWFVAEDGDPSTWTGGTPFNECWPGYQDLRRTK